MTDSPSFNLAPQVTALLNAVEESSRQRKRTISEKRADTARSYRQRKGRVQNHNWVIIRKGIMDRDGHACRICGEQDELMLEVHHITPVCEGGIEAADNLITLCANHHRAAQRGRYDRGHLRSLIGGQSREPTDDELIAWQFDRHGRGKYA
jgi:5-methylcytosine-specific restriction endonuclease McrA